jgi:hypothetical protein
MAISYPLDLPALRFVNAFRFDLLRTVAVSSSPFTGQQQVYEWPAALWQCAFEVMAKAGAESAALDAFALSLRGRVGTVMIGPRHAPRPRGTALTSGVTVFAGGAVAGAREIGLAGLGAGRTLLTGDYLQVGAGAAARLHMAVETATGDGSGAAWVTVEPPLRAAYANGTAVTLVAPKVAMRSTLDRFDAPLGPSGIRTCAFSFVEAL